MTSFIEQNEDYWIVKDEGYGNAIVIKQPWSRRYLEIIDKYQVKIIRLNERVGWTGSEISFLREIRGIHGVDILSDKVTDVSPVFQIKALQTLSLFCKTKIAGNFASLKNLRSVGLGWRPAYESLFNVHSLQRINVVAFPDKDLTRWNRNENLDEMRLESDVLEKLTGLKQFPNIKSLSIYKCPKLKSLDAIASAASIQKLKIGRSSGFRKLSPLASLTELKELEIEDCREIQSLSPIAKCRKLELLQIAGNTTILDGNFTFLTELPNLNRVLLARRAHYSHTPNQLEKQTERQ